MAAFITKKTGYEVRKDATGKMGEFTVWLDENQVAGKEGLIFPDKEKILLAVQQEMEKE